MSKPTFSEIVDKICAQDTRYDSDAYGFVREGLDFTLKSLKRSGGQSRHVSGQELLAGLRDYALKEYGPMSKTLLNLWGVKSCEDFGFIVFNLVNQGILGKTDADSPDDFRNGYSFEEAFVRPFEPRKEKFGASKHRRTTTTAKKKIRPAVLGKKKSLKPLK